MTFLPPDNDPINYPSHYTQHPSGVEQIEITEHMGFCLGNVVKYILRSDFKGDAIEDLKKARWYLEREIKRREIEKHEKMGNHPPQVQVSGVPYSVDQQALRKMRSADDGD